MYRYNQKTARPASRVIRRRRQTPPPPKQCAIVENGTGRYLQDPKTIGFNFGDGDIYWTSEFSKALICPSRRIALKVLSALIKNLPPKASPDEEPRYSVERIK